MNLPDAEMLARRLMGQHGLYQWAFKFDGALTRFGLCRYNNQTIYLSEVLVARNEEPAVRDTILHEIAHALTPGDKHGPEWQRVAVFVGARPVRCIVGADAPKGDIQATCPGCGRTYHRWRFPRRKNACAPCCNLHAGGRVDPRFALTWRLTA